MLLEPNLDSFTPAERIENREEILGRAKASRVDDVSPAEPTRNVFIEEPTRHRLCVCVRYREVRKRVVPFGGRDGLQVELRQEAVMIRDEVPRWVPRSVARANETDSLARR